MKKTKKTLEQQREELKEKQKKALQQINAKITDQKAKEKTKQRKQLTHKKIIAGAIAINHMEKNTDSDFAKRLKALLNEYVTKNNDRTLFNLEPLEKTNQEPEKKE